jgi:surface antigen
MEGQQQTNSVNAGSIIDRLGGMRTGVMIALVVLSLPGAAWAINALSLHNMPINYMTDEDKEILKAAVDDVLERGRDGQSMRWENPKTGAHGDLLPRASFKNDGRPCRDLEVANSARGRDNRLVVTLCKQADGEWKIKPQ